MTTPVPALIYLASASPRRSELLKLAGIHFEVLLIRNLARPGRTALDVVEIRRADESAAAYVERIAHEKAQLGWKSLHWRRLPIHPVLAADTEVILDDEVFGKPQDVLHAIQMLEKLSGQTHEVRTAVCLITPEQTLHAVSVSRVTLPILRAEQIARYVASGEPFGKAGGYGLQGKAALLVERIEGSPSGIIGLPLFETARLLEQAGISL
ncbi:MAG: septum formation inhibitor Maf [Burkholderiaceae bacterium]|nr:MAG: septum formation inhibitor Maf [Burkholderiaceae bacterium]